MTLCNEQAARLTVHDRKPTPLVPEVEAQTLNESVDLSASALWSPLTGMPDQDAYLLLYVSCAPGDYPHLLTPAPIPLPISKALSRDAFFIPKLLSLTAFLVSTTDLRTLLC